MSEHSLAKTRATHTLLGLCATHVTPCVLSKTTLPLLETVMSSIQPNEAPAGELATESLRTQAHELADLVTENEEMLTAAQSRLSNAITHLVRSNKELVRLCATVLCTLVGVHCM